MSGLKVFKSLADALSAGYQVYDRKHDGYLVRTRTAAGWAIALVEIPTKDERVADPDPEC
jgi:hypothetical protein